MDPIFLWLTVAFLAGSLVSLLRMPPLVGYLIAGYVLSAMGQIVTPTLTGLANTGILLLLFTVGLKLKLRSLLKNEVLGVGGLHILVVAVISAVSFLCEFHRVKGGLVLGVALAFSSTVLAFKVLEDNGEIQTFRGRTVMGILILQDVVAVLLLVLAGGEAPSRWAPALLIIPFLSRAGCKIYDYVRSDELRLLLGLLMAMAGGDLAQALGVSPELGALLMGVMISGHPDAKDLSLKLWGLKEIFLIGFFLEIGLHGLPSLEQTELALILLGLLPLQGVLFFVLMTWMGLRARTSFLASLALTTYSEFALIVSAPLIEMGLLDNDWEEALGLAVAGSLALGAMLNRWAQPLYNAFESALKKFERAVPHPDQIPPDFSHADWLVVGLGRTGKAAYRALDRKHVHVMGIDADPVRVAQMKEDGLRAVYGDVEDTELWQHAPLDRLKGIIIAMPVLEARLKALECIRGRGFKGLIGTVSYRQSEDAPLYKLGADEVYRPFKQAGEQLVETMLLTESTLLRKEAFAKEERPDFPVTDSAG